MNRLAQHARFEGDVLARALYATFERRRTPIPESLPLALTPAFATIREKQVQWRGFLRRNGVLAAPQELASVVAETAAFREPVIDAARRRSAFRATWSAGGPWLRAVAAEKPAS